MNMLVCNELLLHGSPWFGMSFSILIFILPGFSFAESWQKMCASSGSTILSTVHGLFSYSKSNVYFGLTISDGSRSFHGA